METGFESPLEEIDKNDLSVVGSPQQCSALVAGVALAQHSQTDSDLSLP